MLLVAVGGCAHGGEPLRLSVSATADGWAKYRWAVRQWDYMCGEVVIDAREAPPMVEVEDDAIQCPPGTPCLGVTRFTRTSDGVEVRGIQVIKSAPAWVWAHEIGHALGAEHHRGGVMATPPDQVTTKVTAADCEAVRLGKLKR